jgi:4-cresol dehydrogenase (hydroxylating)
MGPGADTSSFDEHPHRGFLKKIKDAANPSGILVPGNQTIWPAADRGRNTMKEETQ